MTEETPKKKPRRKRRTKAQIAAEKAVEPVVAVEAPKESVLEPEVAKEEPVESAESTDCETCGGDAAIDALEAAEAAVAEEPVVAAPEPEPAEEVYVPKTGLSKIKHRMEQRRLRRAQQMK